MEIEVGVKILVGESPVPFHSDRQLEPEAELTCCSTRRSLFLFSAQLKVNLRPLWPETCKALAEVSATQASVVWSIIFSEISKATKGDRSLFVEALPDWSTKGIEDEETAGVEGLPEEEEEKTFRDPWRRRSEERVARQMGGEESKLREMGQVSFRETRPASTSFERLR